MYNVSFCCLKTQLYVYIKHVQKLCLGVRLPSFVRLSAVSCKSPLNCIISSRDAIPLLIHAHLHLDTLAVNREHTLLTACGCYKVPVKSLMFITFLYA